MVLLSGSHGSSFWSSVWLGDLSKHWNAHVFLLLYYFCFGHAMRHADLTSLTRDWITYPHSIWGLRVWTMGKFPISLFYDIECEGTMGRKWVGTMRQGRTNNQRVRSGINRLPARDPNHTIWPSPSVGMALRQLLGGLAVPAVEGQLSRDVIWMPKMLQCPRAEAQSAF